MDYIAAARQVQEAVSKGAADYFAGKHGNPYDWETEGEFFRAWIVGYRAARDTQELFA
jgi:hypothetical protein